MSKIFTYIGIAHLTVLAVIGISQIYTRLDIWWMPLVIGILTGMAIAQIVNYIRSSTPDPKQ
jgi:xanthine/uracil permease